MKQQKVEAQNNQSSLLASGVQRLLYSVNRNFLTFRLPLGEERAEVIVESGKDGEQDNAQGLFSSKATGILSAARKNVRGFWAKLGSILEDDKDRKTSHQAGFDPTGEIIDNEWKVHEMLGAGAFGTVHKGRNIHTDEEVAIKMDRSKIRSDLLKREKAIYKRLHEQIGKGKPCIGVPRIKHFGKHGGRNVLVMDCLGDSFQDLVTKGGTFPGRSILSIGIHALLRIEALHDVGYLHRDIKPNNLMVGNENPSVLYLIDFGLAKKYVLPNGVAHIGYKKGEKFAGTPVFASIHAHAGIVQTRRDDLESLGYTLLYLFRGNLPWDRLHRQNIKTENYEDIGWYKKYCSLRDLCRNMPAPVLQYFLYVRRLKFSERPNYSGLRKMFQRGMDNSPAIVV